MLNVKPIPAFHDNYFWLIVGQDNRHCAVVDPGDAKAVVAALTQHQLILSDILITHHHFDHTGGIEDLKSHYQARVYGPSNPAIQGLDSLLADQDTLHLERLGLNFNIIATPGHTLDHISYYGHGSLFCGDTLFAGGCGRLFEGTAETMLKSLERLSDLPTDTKIYCAHEYTLANLKFALSVEPNNKQLQKRYTETESTRAAGKPTLPSYLSTELETNPFMRCHTEGIRSSAEKESKQVLTNVTDVFAVIRKMKDQF